MEDNLIFAFVLTLLAGMSTALGGAVAFTKYGKKESLLSFGLGLAAGAMIFISFFELIVEAMKFFADEEGSSAAFIRVSLAFVGGMAVLAVIGHVSKGVTDKLKVSKFEIEKLSQDEESDEKQTKLYRAGMVTAVALAVHNIPEGLVTFLTAIQDPKLGIGIAIAIGLHNIPEGMAVAMPLYHSLKVKKRIIWLTLIPAAAEPLGALVAYLLFFRSFDMHAIQMVNVFLASIMVYISLFELLPTAFQLKHESYSKWGLLVGMILIGITLAVTG
ncbi:ZIP family metal transporter [Litoribacter ruber]|uniref:ZIP family metal transporter n=1 Tax=Litoribacter ruber TaxID=702568 RepID=A0AAP2CP42_9BACT|nr:MULTISPECIES: ZIP family metal transporter [Litoribacter]MBS9525297.1 ZIP family metal transporter [Litoribacter alkaliphilus]MBT0810122.1 ZIP family metal transporter [Litoribacter ruber]